MTNEVKWDWYGDGIAKVAPGVPTELLMPSYVNALEAKVQAASELMTALLRASVGICSRCEANIPFQSDGWHECDKPDVDCDGHPCDADPIIAQAFDHARKAGITPQP